MIKKPIIAINYKAYENAFGNPASKLLDKIENYAKEYNIETIVTVPLTEIYKAKNFNFIKIYAQTSDAIDFGAHTGKIPTKALIHYGVKGILVNHAENEKKIQEIEKILKDAKDHDLEVLLCSPSSTACLAFSHYKEIDYLAYEVPELIGTGRAISEYHGEDIRTICEKSKNYNSLLKILVGAGISNRKDIDISLQLGADGVFISSLVMKSLQIDNTLEEIFGLW